MIRWLRSESTNQIDLGLDRVVRQDWSIFITVMYTIASYSLPHPTISHNIWPCPVTTDWLHLHHMHHGSSLQKYLHEVRFFSDASEHIWILILSAICFTRIWILTNLRRWDWFDVWFWMYPVSVLMLQMLTQQKTACDAMLDEKNKLITEYQTVCTTIFSSFYYHIAAKRLDYNNIIYAESIKCNVS